LSAIRVAEHQAGKYAPSLTLAFKIAKAFDVPIGQVFQYQQDSS